MSSQDNDSNGKNDSGKNQTNSKEVDQKISDLEKQVQSLNDKNQKMAEQINKTSNVDSKNLEKTIGELENKIENLVHKNIVLEDEIKSLQSPSGKPRRTGRGFVKKGLTYQKNKTKIPATL